MEHNAVQHLHSATLDSATSKSATLNSATLKKCRINSKTQNRATLINAKEKVQHQIMNIK